MRDVAEYLSRLFEVLEEVIEACADFRIAIAENDSVDRTAELAHLFAERHGRVSILQYPGLSALLPERTDRLSFLRNSIIEEFVSATQPEHNWTVLMLDADEVTSALTCSDVLALVDFLTSHPEFCAASANSQPAYYDVWTLRSDDWSIDDCWAQVARRPASLSRAQATRMFVAERQRSIPANSIPIPAWSAFGGLAAYHLSEIKHCRYNGRSESGEIWSEHVRLNLELTTMTGKPLAIVPSVNVVAPPEHLAGRNLRAETAVSPSFNQNARRAKGRATKVLASGSVFGRRLAARSGITRNTRIGQSSVRSIDEFLLVMDADHALPRYAARFRAYDRPIRSLGLTLRRSYGRCIRVIDVGANIGDTTVALVIGTGADVLAIEGDQQYLASLRANTAPIAARVTICGDYVTAGTGSFSSIAQSSRTARLINEQPGAITDGPSITTRGLHDLLIDARWDRADLFKSDTDGHDFEIIGAALDFPWPEKPVLFFEFDPSLNSGGAPAGLAVIEAAISKGYRRWYVWDNFGNFLCRIESDYRRSFETLNAYLARCQEAGGGLNYVDVAAFCDHHPPFDGAVELRSK